MHNFITGLIQKTYSYITERCTTRLQLITVKGYLQNEVINTLQFSTVHSIKKSFLSVKQKCNAYILLKTFSYISSEILLL